MECLSRTGAVELEARSGRAERLAFPELDEELKAHYELARRYQGHWPAAVATQRRQAEPLAQTLSSARSRLATWAEKADPIIAAIERLSRDIGNLDQLSLALAHAGTDLPDLRLLVGAGPRLQVRLVRLAAETKLRDLPALVLFKTWEAPSAKYLLRGRPAIRYRGNRGTARRAQGASLIPLPSWLPASIDAARSAIAQRQAELAHEMQTAQGAAGRALRSSCRSRARSATSR